MAEFRTWVKWTLFLSAYAPLWISISIDTYDVKTAVSGYMVPIVSILFVMVAVVSSLVLYLAMGVRESKEPVYRVVQSYQRRDELMSSYLVAYIIPFIGLNYNSIHSWAILFIFLSVLASIQIRSDQLYINPLLSVLGYKIYEMDCEELGSSLVVVDKGIQVQQGSLKMTEIGRGVYISTDGS